jgi:hypothetical protein
MRSDGRMTMGKWRDTSLTVTGRMQERLCAPIAEFVALTKGGRRHCLLRLSEII